MGSGEGVLLHAAARSEAAKLSLGGQDDKVRIIPATSQCSDVNGNPRAAWGVSTPAEARPRRDASKERKKEREERELRTSCDVCHDGRRQASVPFSGHEHQGWLPASVLGGRAGRALPTPPRVQ